MLAVSLIAAGCGDASAKSRIKKPAPEPEQVSWQTRYAGATPPPARFFTINDVLAKHDGLSHAGTVQVASIDASTVANAAVASDQPATSPLPAFTSEEPFGLFTFRAPEGLLWEKWRTVEAKMRSEASQIETCRSDAGPCADRSKKFIALTNTAVATDIQTRVETINRNVNQAIRYVSDFQQHGVADLWSSPLETLAAGAGDCEDYAIAKFAVLQDAGIPEQDLKVLLVRDLSVRQDHAVLAVRIEGRWLVLDNRRSGVAEARDLSDLMPQFAIDHHGVSLFAAPYAERLRHESEIDMLPAADVGGMAGGATLPLLL